MASAYGDGHRGFGYAINLETGAHKNWSSPWGQIIPDQKTLSIPVNGAVLIGQEGSRGTRISYLLINPENMGSILPSEKIQLSREEEKALAIMKEYTSAGRKEAFPRYGLGKYSPQNQYIQRLVTNGLVVQKGRGLRVTTLGKNMSKQVSNFYEDSWS